MPRVAVLTSGSDARTVFLFRHGSSSEGDNRLRRWGDTSAGSDEAAASVAAASHSTMLSAILSGIRSVRNKLIEIEHEFGLPSDINAKRAWEIHNRVYAAIAARKPAQAGEAARKMVEFARQMYGRVFNA